MRTVLILASRKEEKYVKEFWSQLYLLRKQFSHLHWPEPCYIEDLTRSQVTIPREVKPYALIGCLSTTLLNAVLQTPVLQAIVQQAERVVPFVISDCHWNEYPSPFADLTQLIPKNQGRQILITKQKERDSLYVIGVHRIKDILTR